MTAALVRMGKTTAGGQNEQLREDRINNFRKDRMNNSERIE